MPSICKHIGYSPVKGRDANSSSDVFARLAEIVDALRVILVLPSTPYFILYSTDVAGLRGEHLQ